MKNAMRDILLFGAGFAAGAYFMHTMMRRAYDEKYRKEAQDLKAHWEKREANLDEEVEKKANQKGFELAMGPYRTESDPEDIRKPEQAIEIIEPDEFGADENYETSFLSFYADGKLVFDGEDEPMDEDDISRAIGDEALKHFGEFMPNTIHVNCLCNLVEKRNNPGEFGLYADVMYVEQDADSDPYAERYARFAAPEADMAEPSDPHRNSVLR